MYILYRKASDASTINSFTRLYLQTASSSSSLLESVNKQSHSRSPRIAHCSMGDSRPIQCVHRYTPQPSHGCFPVSIRQISLFTSPFRVQMAAADSDRMIGQKSIFGATDGIFGVKSNTRLNSTSITHYSGVEIRFLLIT